MVGKIQSIYFLKDKFTQSQAKKWLVNHHMKTDIDITKTQFRYRQRNPKIFTRFITIKRGGIYFVIGY